MVSNIRLFFDDGDFEIGLFLQNEGVSDHVFVAGIGLHRVETLNNI